MKKLVVLLGLLAVLGVAGQIRAADTPQTLLHVGRTPIRVMALGDSITAGVMSDRAPDGGYRKELQELLRDHNYNVTFVGSRSDFSGDMSDPEHEGWPGYVIRSYPSHPAGQLSGSIVSAAVRQNNPDVILLMVGTNDFLRATAGDAGYTPTQIERNMDELIREIFAAKPDVHIIVAGIIDSPRLSQCTIDAFDTGTSACGESLTGGLPALVAKYQLLGRSIALATGMNRAVPRTQAGFPDGLHPSTNGYRNMALVWYDALQAAMPPATIAAQR